MENSTSDTKTRKNLLCVTSIETPIGNMLAAATREGVCLLEFKETPLHINDYSRILKFLNVEISEGNNKFLDIAKEELTEYFKGNRKIFSVPLHLVGTDFQLKVWKGIQEIPFGKNKTYKQQASELNQPGALRAIAHANGQNPVSIIIPCHRVIGSNGKLVGYSGGLWRKRWLLEHERINSPLAGTLF